MRNVKSSSGRKEITFTLDLEKFCMLEMLHMKSKGKRLTWLFLLIDLNTLKYVRLKQK